MSRSKLAAGEFITEFIAAIINGLCAKPVDSDSSTSTRSPKAGQASIDPRPVILEPAYSPTMHAESLLRLFAPSVR